MQDRHPPSFPSDVDDLDSDEILEDDVLEEIVDLDDSISESTSSSGSENTDSPQKDDAVCVFRGHASSKNESFPARDIDIGVILSLFDIQ